MTREMAPTRGQKVCFTHEHLVTGESCRFADENPLHLQAVVKWARQALVLNGLGLSLGEHSTPK
jgi:hypothetical protein